MSSPKHFLVTGGAGFVGSHLVDRLIKLNHRVTVLDNLSSGMRSNVHQSATFVEGDICDFDLLKRLIGEVDACYHLAAIASVQECQKSWASSHDVNLNAFVSLLQITVERKGGPIPIVYASSAAVYGNVSVFPVHEDMPMRPISLYGADKGASELHARAAGYSGGVPTFGLRPFNIYGPRQHASSPYSGVITVFASLLKQGKGLTIYGDGKQTRDFIYVSDIIDYFIAALPHASSDAPVANAATGKETSIMDVAHKLAGLLHQKAEITLAPARSGDIYRSVASIERADTFFGKKSHVDIAEGLKFVLEK